MSLLSWLCKISAILFVCLEHNDFVIRIYVYYTYAGFRKCKMFVRCSHFQNSTDL